MAEKSNPKDAAAQADEGVKIRKKSEPAAEPEGQAPREQASAPAPRQQASSPEPAEPEPRAQEGGDEEGFDPNQLSRRVVDPNTRPAEPQRSRGKPQELRTFDEGATTDDFAALFEGGGGQAPERQKLEVGDSVVAPITHIDRRHIFVDLGGRNEARAPRGQYEDDGELEVAVGEEHEFYVLRFTREGVELGKHLDTREAGLSVLEDAEASGAPIQGRVESKNKGGFVVDINGVKAFCPVSQIDMQYVEDLDVYLGQTFRFQVTEVREGGRNVVVSRASLQRQEAAEQRKKTLAALEQGSVTTGTVRSIRDFGAFVDLGGVDGLVHVSEMGWGNINDPREVLSEGDTVEVKVLDIEREEGGDVRIGLSIKQLEQDPWERVNEELAVGDKVRGLVVRTAPFGAFVELMPGVDGLVHVSEMSWEHVRRPDDVLEVGQSVEVEVQDIDLVRQRVSLSMKSLEGDPWEAAAEDYPVGDEVQGIVEKIEDFGVFVNLGEGITALLPRSEMQLNREQTPHSKARQGATITARVLQVEPGRRRMALTLREDVDPEQEARRAEERERSSQGRDGDRPRRQDRPSSSSSSSSKGSSSGGSFGTLGDLINMKRDED